MSEPQAKPKLVLSDPKILHKIKFVQIKRQLIPVSLVIGLLILNIFWFQNWMLYPILAAFGWYLLERIMFRTRNKILAPEAATFVSPVDGKVASFQHLEDSILMTIKKSFLDVVELRLPFPDKTMEKSDTWLFETPHGKVTMRIYSPKAIYFTDTNVQGGVVGMVPYNAEVTLQIPSGYQLQVQKGQNLIGGETVLFDLNEPFVEHRSIVVEEPLEEFDNSPEV